MSHPKPWREVIHKKACSHTESSPEGICRSSRLTLTLECGHTVNRSDTLAPPKKVRCWKCEGND